LRSPPTGRSTNALHAGTGGRRPPRTSTRSSSARTARGSGWDEEEPLTTPMIRAWARPAGERSGPCAGGTTDEDSATASSSPGRDALRRDDGPASDCRLHERRARRNRTPQRRAGAQRQETAQRAGAVFSSQAASRLPRLIGGRPTRSNVAIIAMLDMAGRKSIDQRCTRPRREDARQSLPCRTPAGEAIQPPTPPGAT
jgi:hypothetical protein